MTTSPTRAADRPALPALDPSRPFGVHIRMAWWKSLILIVALPVTILLSQIVFYLLAGLIEGNDPFSPTLTPLKLLATNLSLGITALLAVVLVSRFAGVPWRSVFSSARRFDRRRLGIYLVVAAVIMGIAIVVLALVAPEAGGRAGFGITGFTVAMLVVIVLSTPLQSAAEEVIFRGAMLPAAGSWFRAVGPALIAGSLVSSVAFALVHGATDPVLVAYYIYLSLGAVAMGLMTRGLEAAMAWHVANNLVAMINSAVFADGGAVGVDRTEGQGGGAALLIPAAGILVVVGAVWLIERRRSARSAG